MLGRTIRRLACSSRYVGASSLIGSSWSRMGVMPRCTLAVTLRNGQSAYQVSSLRLFSSSSSSNPKSDSSASSSSSSSPKGSIFAEEGAGSGSGGVLGFIGEEMGHIQEQLLKSGVGKAKKQARTLYDVEGVDWGAVLHRHLVREQMHKDAKDKAAEDLMRGAETEDAPYTPTFTSEEPPAAAEGAEAAAGEAQEEQEEPAEEKPVSALVTAKGSETVWEKRMDGLKDVVRGSFPFSAVRKAKHAFATSENELIEKVRGVQEDMANRREDLEEALETTQNPMVWKVRDAGDAMFGESEEAWAVGELLRVDPDFSVYDFAEHMQHYMLPVFLEGFLSGNAAMMECVCEGQAESLWQTNFKERTTKGEVPDTGVLDIDHLDVASTIVTDHTPYLVVTFVTQQVNCTRSVETGDIATGHEGDIRQVFYHMKLKKDFESEHFDWKITEMQFQNMAALAG